jgi:peptide methionine sulfoxide reductase msrA/msrB
LELPDFTDSDLKNRLTPLQYKVTQKNGTERAFSDWNYHDNKKAWIYVDVVDGTALYSSTHKYDSGTWWPSFWRSLDESHLVYKEDNSLFSKRTEVRSKNADSHLGHIFTDGPSDKWGVRHCINGASLLFIPEDKLEEYWYWKYAELF